MLPGSKGQGPESDLLCETGGPYSSKDMGPADVSPPIRDSTDHKQTNFC